MIKTERLILRPWREDDAEALFRYACDPAVGPAAGWPAHKNVEESLNVIKNVLAVPECYAICPKEGGGPIGSIALHLKGHTDMTDRDDECELGYWLGRPFWGRGLMPEAVRALLRHAFCDIGMRSVWCGYYEGNEKSHRVQQKCGFRPQWVTENVEVPLMGETRRGYVSRLTKAEWLAMQEEYLFLDLRRIPELEQKAAEWFHGKWSVPAEAYLECMDAYLTFQTEYGWYLCLYRGDIVGGLGVIENDFHERHDLSPNVCAVYTEEAHRGRGVAGRLLGMAVEDLRGRGVSPVYLVTDHTGFYERYGWRYLCPVLCDGGETSRMYVHY